MFFVEYVSSSIIIKSSRSPCSRSVILFFLDFLFLILNFLEPVKFFSFKFIKFRNDVSQCPFDLWNDDMLDSIDSSVGCFNDLIQSNERCLKRSQLNQQIDCLLVICLQSLQLLTSFGQTCQFIGISSILV